MHLIYNEHLCNPKELQCLCVISLMYVTKYILICTLIIIFVFQPLLCYILPKGLCNSWAWAMFSYKGNPTKKVIRFEWSQFLIHTLLKSDLIQQQQRKQVQLKKVFPLLRLSNDKCLSLNS